MTRVERGVGVVVVRDGRVLMGRRRGSHDPGTWCLPGGAPDAAESETACAVRELREETGLRGTAVRVVYRCADRWPASGRVFATAFVAVTADGEPAEVEPHAMGDWTWVSRSAPPQPLFGPVVSWMRAGCPGWGPG